jgi:hypothetical protein
MEQIPESRVSLSSGRFASRLSTGQPPAAQPPPQPRYSATSPLALAHSKKAREDIAFIERKLKK